MRSALKRGEKCGPGHTLVPTGCHVTTPAQEKPAAVFGEQSTPHLHDTVQWNLTTLWIFTPVYGRKLSSERVRELPKAAQLISDRAGDHGLQAQCSFPRPLRLLQTAPQNAYFSNNHENFKKQLYYQCSYWGLHSKLFFFPLQKLTEKKPSDLSFQNEQNVVEALACL